MVAEERELIVMHARLVPIAMFMGTPVRVRVGTMRKPPPTPKSPAMSPMPSPKRKFRRYSSMEKYFRMAVKNPPVVA